MMEPIRVSEHARPSVAPRLAVEGSLGVTLKRIISGLGWGGASPHAEVVPALFNLAAGQQPDCYNGIHGIL